MKKNTIKKKDISKKIFNKWFLSALGILWIVSTIFAFKALRQVPQIQERVVENKITEKTSFNYKVEVDPCTLFPSGGIVDPKDSMYTKIVRAIHLNLSSNVTSDKPVTTQGTKKVFVRLIAEGLWERDFVLEAENKISLQGKENKVVENDYVIDIKNIAAYIDKVEKEITLRPDKYFLNIKPQIEGNTVYEDTKIPMDTAPEISFEFSGQIKQIGEREFIKETPIQTTITRIQNFEFLNIQIPVNAARYIFSSSSVVLLAIIILGACINIKGNRKDSSEASIIDKKYSRRLILIDENIAMLNKLNVNVRSFKALIQLADDKEQPILRYKDSNKNSVFYYVIDGDCIYCYTAEDKMENLSLPEVSNNASENSIEQSQ